MTNSVSWQDELNLALWLATRAGGAILPARDTGYIRQGKFILFWCFIPYNKSLIDQACSVKMAGYWPRSFFLRVYETVMRPRRGRGPWTRKKELGQYPAILTEQAWIIAHYQPSQRKEI